MNKLSFTLFICFGLLIFSQNFYSYSCLGTNFVDKSAKGLRTYYQKQSNLVIFTGKVLSVEKVKSARLIVSARNKDEKTQIEEDPSNFVFRKVLTVEADKFWLGNPELKQTVNIELNNGFAEGVYEVGDEIFFITRRDEENKLWLGFCDYSLYSKLDHESLIAKFTEIFGEPNTF